MTNRSFRVLLAVFACSLPPAAASAADFAGHWEGGIPIGGEELGVVLDLARDGEAWKGEIDIPIQGIRNLALVDVKVEATRLRFTVPGGAGAPEFEAVLSEDGATATGTFRQAGQAMPFHLERNGAAAFGQIPKDDFPMVKKGTPGTGLAGEWHGMLEMGPSRLRLVLHVERSPEGVMSAKMDSVDQGARGLAVDKVTLAEKAVGFEMTALGAGYDGVLNADGSEISGTWKQGQASLPLTFKRK